MGEGGGGQAKVDKCGQGEGGWGWLAKCGHPLGKKIIATIFVKFTQDNLAECLCIKFSFCLYSIENVEIFVWPIMPVCHTYFMVNPTFWNAIIEIV